jgi:DNA-binding MarR family transcriptional regulator/GNAT superfamily N-acetyltransferase
MASAGIATRIEAVRRFSRFYTRKIGALQDGYLRSPFSLTEARVLYELAHREKTTASELGTELALDAGYLSRILRAFERRGLIEKRPSETDRRQSIVSLTNEGLQSFATLNSRSGNEIAGILSELSPADQNRVVDAMRTIERLLGAPSRPPRSYILRPHQPGDMGWVVHRHGVWYAQEYGWDERFEALVAEIVAQFIQRYDPQRERCWMAEMEGEIVGSVFLVKHSDEVGRLRLLLVEPKARGLGVGTRLVEECIRFARHAGYRNITLWTNSILVAARRIYERAGFQLVREEPHQSFGPQLIGQTWELTLD